ncbi:MAG: Fur family transcriptional regulator [Pseudomonadota bacterium]
MPTALPHHDQASRLLQQRGASLTPARVRVLQLLLAADAAMSHQDLQLAAGAGGRPFDKVTLYRVLDWLVAQGLVHSVTGHDRVRRFSPLHAHATHAHFECRDCGRLFCLDDAAPLASPALPPGFEPDHLEITVHGRCADCASPAA